jgi:hypothetical protein
MHERDQLHRTRVRMEQWTELRGILGWEGLVTGDDPDADGDTRSALAGISCTSSTVCTAVGSDGHDQPLAEVSAGSTWSVQAAATPASDLSSDLTSVSCTSMTACTAVGSHAAGLPDPDHPTYARGNDVTLAESWDGRHWSIQPTPNPSASESYSYNELASVSCTSASVCLASGSGYDDGTTDGYVERWDGSDWSATSIPSPAGSTYAALSSLSCTSDTTCTGVGSYGDSPEDEQMLAETWNGDTWSIEPTITPPDFGGLNGLSCTSTTTCMAVGNTAETGAGSISSPVSQSTLAQQLSGTTWSSVPSPNPSDNSLSRLNGVSCVATRACDAVGSGSADGGINADFAESWDGMRWTLHTTPSQPGGSGAELYGISCASSTACIGVGDDTNSSATSRR